MPKKDNKQSNASMPTANTEATNTNTAMDQIISVTIDGVSSLKQNLAGKIISLNLKVDSFFGLEGSSIWLTPEKYWAEVPDNLSSRNYEIISNCIRIGKLVLGKVYIPPVDKVSNICEHYWALVEKTGFETKNTKSAFTTLLRKGQDSGWTAIEIAQFCLDKEKKSKNRKTVIDTLTQIVTRYNGPIQLYDPPDDAEGIKKVTIMGDGTMVGETNSGKKVAKPMSPKPPDNFVPGNKTSEQAISDLLK